MLLEIDAVREDRKLVITSVTGKTVLRDVSKYSLGIITNGLPLQNEYPIPFHPVNYRTSNTFHFNGTPVKEKIRVRGFEDMLLVTNKRSISECFEEFLYTESWKIKKKIVRASCTGTFIHNEGEYMYTALKVGTTEDIKEALRVLKLKHKLKRDFISETCSKAEASALWFKKYKCRGVLPPIYYRIFHPPLPQEKLENAKGWILEIGTRDNQWYKMFSVSGDVLILEQRNTVV